MERRKHDRSLGAVTILALAAVALIASAALAQDTPLQDRDRDQDRTKDQLHQRLHDRIEDCQGATAEQRQEMAQNLEQGLKLGLDAESLDVLFPAQGAKGEDVGQLLRFQRRVLGAAAEGLPAEPLAAKIREGRMKGVPGEALAGAVEQIEQQLRAADRVMTRAAKGGVEVPTEPAQRHEAVRDMSRTLRQGLDEAALDQLRDRACERARDGSCTAREMVAAAGAAGRLRESGVEAERAVRIAGEALRRGYDPDQMSRIGLMAMAAHQHRGGDELADELEGCLQDGMTWREMERHMTQAGWLGPAETGGHQGSGDGDHLGGGPGGPGTGGTGGHGDDNHGGGGAGGEGTGGTGGGGTGGGGSGGGGGGGI